LNDNLYKNHDDKKFVTTEVRLLLISVHTEKEGRGAGVVKTPLFCAAKNLEQSL
jgi:hypothetical protein